MYINLQGGAAIMPEHLTEAHGGGYAQGYGGGGYHGGGGGHHQQHQQQGGYHGGQQQQQQMNYQQQQGGYQQGGQQQQGVNPNAELEAEVKKYLPTVLRMCQRSCCTIM